MVLMGSIPASEVRFTTIALAAVPFVAITLLYAFAWHTSLTFGAWPTYASPDPKSANSALHLAAGLALIASPPSTVGLVALTALSGRNRFDVAAVVASLVGMAALIAVFSGDLGDWYMD